MSNEMKVASAIAFKDIVDENEHLRIKYSVQDKQIRVLNEQIRTLNEQLQALNEQMQKSQKALNIEQQKLFNTKTSISFQVGQVIVRAFTKPGKNTLLAPYYLLRIVLTR